MSNAPSAVEIARENVERLRASVPKMEQHAAAAVSALAAAEAELAELEAANDASNVVAQAGVARGDGAAHS